MANDIEYYEIYTENNAITGNCCVYSAEKVDEMNITQAQLAEMLNIRTAKLSQILNGKRKPDVPFLKAIHKKLNLDGNFILESV